jgi:long-chain acyl-CoA synthetase
MHKIKCNFGVIMNSPHPWLSSYEPGTPHNIDITAYPSLNQLMAQACQKFHDAPAFRNFGQDLSFGELEQQVAAFAAYLCSVPGLVAGERVAIMLPNILQYPVVLFGVLRAGLVVVNVNPLYTERELAHQLQDSGARAIIVLENFAAKVAQVMPKTALQHVWVTQIADMLPPPKRWLMNFVVRHLKKMIPPWHIPQAQSLMTAFRAGAALPPCTRMVAQNDIAFLQYTSGTTGEAKGAILTHANVLSNVLQCRAWIGGQLKERAEVVLTPLPLYHVFSLVANCLTFMMIGGLNVLITNPKDLPAFVKLMRREPWTAITGVNTLFNGLTKTPGFGPDCVRFCKLSVGGGAAMLRPVSERWMALTKTPLVEGYGLSEATAGVCINPLSHPRIGMIGLPISSTQVQIWREDGTLCEPNEVGELVVRGPQIMRGYWQRPAETAEVLTADGWLKTGDIGSMNQDGWVQISDRKKDMIIVSGFNVYPAEIESVVAALPGVLEAAVVGMADEQTGEAVKLFVVRSDPNLSSEMILAHCGENLARYKIPRQIEFRTELPKTPIGKILRRCLRDHNP